MVGCVDDPYWSGVPLPVGYWLTLPRLWPRGRRPGWGQPRLGFLFTRSLGQVNEISRLPSFTPLHSLLRRALTDNFLRTPYLAQDLHTVEPPAPTSAAARDADGSDDPISFWRKVLLDSAE
jgi:hypothetical protein